MDKKTWFHEKLTFPILHKFGVNVLWAIGILIVGLASALVIEMLGGCNPAVTPTVRAGEKALFYGHIGEAAQLAKDGLVEAPNCGCANLLMAEVEVEQIKRLSSSAPSALRDDLRDNCFKHAHQAHVDARFDLRAATLEDVCSAAGSLQFQ